MNARSDGSDLEVDPDAPRWLHPPHPSTPLGVTSAIEDIVLAMLASLASGDFPDQPQSHAAASSSKFNVATQRHEEQEAEPHEETGKLKLPKNMYRSARGRLAYLAKDLAVLATAHGCVRDGRTMTQRELYYQQVNLFGKSQAALNRTVMRVAHRYVGVKRSDLNIVAAAKGIMSGRLHLSFPAAPAVVAGAGAAGAGTGVSAGVGVDARAKHDVTSFGYDGGGASGRTVEHAAQPQPQSLPPPPAPIMPVWMTTATSIPANISDAVLHSDATVCLVVEKEAIFQQLLSSPIPILEKAILITGKGYPDVTTRLLCNRISSELNIPTFALVDCDPHGIMIMLTYLHGSEEMAFEAATLAAPAMQWLGLLPSDLSVYSVDAAKKLPLTVRDKQQLEQLLVKPAVLELEDSQVAAEVEKMLASGIKAELEAVQLATFLTAKIGAVVNSNRA